MSYKIIGDSCCDYTSYDNGMPWLERVSLSIDLDGVTYIDNEQLDCDKLLRKMKESDHAPKSACPSPGQYLDAYDCGADEVFVVTLSGALSGSYNSAEAGAMMFKDKYSDTKKIHVFNSRSAAAGQICICLKIKELKEAGESFESVVEKTEEFISNMTTLFVLENLDVFRKNGRLNHLEAIITATLRIKLVMCGESDGNVGIKAKALTNAAAIGKLVDAVKKKCEGKDMSNTHCVITHCNCLQKAEKLRESIKSACNFKDFIMCRSSGISTIYENDGGVIVSF